MLVGSACTPPGSEHASASPPSQCWATCGSPRVCASSATTRDSTLDAPASRAPTDPSALQADEGPASQGATHREPSHRAAPRQPGASLPACPDLRSWVGGAAVPTVAPTPFGPCRGFTTRSDDVTDGRLGRRVSVPDLGTEPCRMNSLWAITPAPQSNTPPRATLAYRRARPRRGSPIARRLEAEIGPSVVWVPGRVSPLGQDGVLCVAMGRADVVAGVGVRLDCSSVPNAEASSAIASPARAKRLFGSLSTQRKNQASNAFGRRMPASAARTLGASRGAWLRISP